MQAGTAQGSVARQLLCGVLPFGMYTVSWAAEAKGVGGGGGRGGGGSYWDVPLPLFPCRYPSSPHDLRPLGPLPSYPSANLAATPPLKPRCGGPPRRRLLHLLGRMGRWAWEVGRQGVAGGGAAARVWGAACGEE